MLFPQFFWERDDINTKSYDCQKIIFRSFRCNRDIILIMMQTEMFDENGFVMHDYVEVIQLKVIANQPPLIQGYDITRLGEV